MYAHEHIEIKFWFCIEKQKPIWVYFLNGSECIDALLYIVIL